MLRYPVKFSLIMHESRIIKEARKYYIAITQKGKTGMGIS